MELYPIKFTAILKDKIWGGKKLKSLLSKREASDNCGESWELSGIEGDESIVKNGFLKGNNLNELIEIYMADLLGEKVYEKFGEEFPLLFKFIDASKILSIQVHPDDKLSKKRHNAYGKTEMWYVLDADKDSEIITGFKKELSKKEYTEVIENNQIKEYLNIEKVQKSDSFLIPSGRIHTIGKGILLAEVQQTSDITYRIYDWDRKDDDGNGRELHTDLAKDALDYKVYDNYKTEYTSQLNESVNIADTKYFTTNLLELDKAIENNYSFLDSFIVYMCVEGELEVLLNNGTSEILKKGETVLIPAIAELVTLKPKTKSKVLEIYIKSDFK